MMAVKKYLLFRSLYVLFMLLVFLAPEICARMIARFTPPVGTRSLYKEISQGYALHDQLVADWRALHFEYRDYYLYSPGPASSKTVNFTSYFGARATPASVDVKDAKEIIWTFGGSTMQNLEADDELTLANQIATELNKQGIPTHLYNFGTGAFQSSLETVKFQDLLRRTPPREHPTTVIFYDGFNDSIFAYLYGAGRFQSDTSSKLQDLIERDYPRLFIYAASEWLGDRSVFWNNYMRKRVDITLHAGHPPDDSRENLVKAVTIYATNVKMTKGICKELGIRCLFFLQPLVITKHPLGAVEATVVESLGNAKIQFGQTFYNEVRLVLADEPVFHDISHILDGIEGSHFFDYGHTSPFAGVPIGKAIALHVIRARELVHSH